jgi:ferritin-like metal-binding protein YciE
MAKSSSKNQVQEVVQEERVVVEDSMLQEFFTESIKDIYYAEKHIVKTLPKMSKASTSAELKSAFKSHLDLSKVHVTRLEEVFAMMGMKPRAKKCEAIEGITKEGEGVIEDTEAGSATRDVALIMAAQKVEHYEIASYGGLVQLAAILGMNEISDLLATTLQEEKEADLELSAIAENNVNYAASQEEEA